MTPKNGSSADSYLRTTRLETSLECVAREFGVEGTNIADLEVKLINEFMRHYHLYTAGALPKRGDTLDWLTLMRRHGAGVGCSTSLSLFSSPHTLRWRGCRGKVKNRGYLP